MNAPIAPVLVLQFVADDGPAYLGTWLKRHAIAFDLRSAAEGAVFPNAIDGFAGLALLGGAMSANDDLPFLHTAQRLIGQALRADIPVLGHCLGGQLMARTLGAPVGASPQPEVGWHAMSTADSPVRAAWFGADAQHHVFHWHYEAFGIPAGCERLAGSVQCPNQAFALGPHLAMQFHVEVDAAKIALWLQQNDPLYRSAQREHISVHAPERIRDDTARLLEQQQRLADRIYECWARNLIVPS